jgi:hypothetical protein
MKQFFLRNYLKVVDRYIKKNINLLIFPMNGQNNQIIPPERLLPLE